MHRWQRLVIAGLLGVMTLQFNCVFGDDMSSKFNSHHQGAQFVRGATTLANAFMVGPTGGVFKIRGPDKSLESICVKIPPNAVTTETLLSVGFNNGTLFPARGDASGYIIVLDVQRVRTFQQAIAIIVHKPQSLQKGVPVGFSIEENDQIKLIDSVFDKKSGTITFYSFRPIMFTWVYTKTNY